jgi:hypothetical protein
MRTLKTNHNSWKQYCNILISFEMYFLYHKIHKSSYRLVPKYEANISPLRDYWEKYWWKIKHNGPFNIQGYSTKWICKSSSIRSSTTIFLYENCITIGLIHVSYYSRNSLNDNWSFNLQSFVINIHY